MWLITRKMMRRDLGMLVPAGIAIIIGTLFITMTFLFGNTIDASMRRKISSEAAQANYAIIPEDENQAQAKTLKDFRINELAGVKGVSALKSDASLMVDVHVGKTKSEGW